MTQCHRDTAARHTPVTIAVTAVVLGLALCLAGPGCEANAQQPASPAASLVQATRFAEAPSFCGEPVPIERQEVRERLEKEMLLMLWDRPQVLLWLKRSPRFLPLVTGMLHEAGLPADLAYLPIIESALRPHATSPAGAVGFWQFTRSTGRRYGLRIDDTIDERRSLRAATTAAISYLEELYGLLGSWTLAAAAYNMGEHGLLAEVLVQHQRDYYELALPQETERYLPRLVVAKLICSDPAAYGFHLAADEQYRPVAVDQVTVTCVEAMPILLLAEAAATSFKTIKELNPELRAYHLDPGTYQLAVPAGAGQGFAARLGQVRAHWRQVTAGQTYVVKQGENLSLIAERFQVPLPALLIWNRLDPSEPIHPGDRLLIGDGDRSRR